MKRILVAGALALAVFMAPQAVSAAPIVGSIGISGPANPSGGATWGTATGVSFVNPSIVDALTQIGDYSGVPAGTEVTYTNFTFSPSLSPDPVEPLWTFTIGATTYSFKLTSINVVFQDPVLNTNFLLLSGTGIASITGYDDTEGEWDFSGQSTGGSFNFSSTTATLPVPEPAMLALFGLGLLGAARRYTRK